MFVPAGVAFGGSLIDASTLSRLAALTATGTWKMLKSMLPCVPSVVYRGFVRMATWSASVPPVLAQSRNRTVIFSVVPSVNVSVKSPPEAWPPEASVVAP